MHNAKAAPNNSKPVIIIPGVASNRYIMLVSVKSYEELFKSNVAATIPAVSVLNLVLPRVTALK